MRFIKGWTLEINCSHCGALLEIDENDLEFWVNFDTDDGKKYYINGMYSFIRCIV